MFGHYGWSRSRNNTDGAFSTPATGSLDAEWGPSNGDVRHRGNISLSTGFLRNFNASIDFSLSSAPPITIRTGFDDNGDLIFNDRPAGVGRNTERTTGQWQSFAYFSYWIGLGKRQVAGGGVGPIMIREGHGRPVGGADGRAGAAALPAVVQRQDLEPHEPLELRRLQRRHDVAVLPEADVGVRRAPDQFRDEFELLRPRGSFLLFETNPEVLPLHDPAPNPQ